VQGSQPSRLARLLRRLGLDEAMTTTPTSSQNAWAADEASRLMMSFAARTGLTSDAPSRRYLWTDAFAVCNFLGLARVRDEEHYTELALRLVDEVHRVLGTYRDDDERSGWISGLSDGALHPTRGGLRIGKPLPERRVSEPFDEELEWRRDGQYFHYLTKWMHALDQVHRWTGEARYSTWARELAKVAHDAFVRAGHGGLRMAWKMSTDLTRPLVPSMGHHDPLDGFITCVQLDTARTRADISREPSLTRETADFATMVAGGQWATADPLGLGGLLADASRVAQLQRFGAFRDSDLLSGLLGAAQRGLGIYSHQGDLRQPASRRLAFRELGLAIGLSAVDLIEEPLRTLAPYLDLGDRIRSFWLEPRHRETRIWLEHRDIDDVMLATSLVAEGFLLLE
jgi:hypothetical protein